jgi:hypothetical protein
MNIMHIRIDLDFGEQQRILGQSQMKLVCEAILRRNKKRKIGGARPAIMWVCCLGLLTQFFVMPIAEWATAIWAPDVALPELNTEQLMTLTLSLLGLGGMRSFEKSKGVARENLK